MAKTYEVKVDVTMTGSIYIEADSPEEAKHMACNKRIVASDLRNFYENGIEVVEVGESED